mmetsp:Transcript_451/g.1669  ORF Transcript_451/g.1669 Transcript_451/m.1669 type:complete len:311 (-) Transcript_451:58-990(-)
MGRQSSAWTCRLGGRAQARSPGRRQARRPRLLGLRPSRSGPLDRSRTRRRLRAGASTAGGPPCAASRTLPARPRAPSPSPPSRGAHRQPPPPLPARPRRPLPAKSCLSSPEAAPPGAPAIATAAPPSAAGPIAAPPSWGPSLPSALRSACVGTRCRAALRGPAGAGQPAAGASDPSWSSGGLCPSPGWGTPSTWSTCPSSSAAARCWQWRTTMARRLCGPSSWSSVLSRSWPRWPWPLSSTPLLSGRATRAASAAGACARGRRRRPPHCSSDSTQWPPSLAHAPSRARRRQPALVKFRLEGLLPLPRLML